MNEIDTTTMILQGALRTLAMLPVSDLEAHVRECSNSLQMFHSMGSMLDPTEYRNSMENGKLEDAQRQLEIARLLLKIRELIEEREAWIKERTR